MTVDRAAVHHRPESNFAYAVNDRQVTIRLRSRRGNLDRCRVLHGDKFDWANRERTDMSIARSDAEFDYWEVTLTPPHRRLCYAFMLEAGEEALWLTEWGFESRARKDLPTAGEQRPLHYFEYPYVHGSEVVDPPDWVSDAVFYQIFPDRFENGDPDNDPEDVEDWGNKPTLNNKFGGDLQGIIDRIDHLEDLGITALYLTPIFESSSNHKYNIANYRRVDPHFGTKESLSDLVATAHDHGIRVMLDAVFNHCGRQFAPFQDVIENGQESEYVDWFHINEFPIEFEPRPTYDTFGFESYMPKLNTENPEVRSYLLDVATHWIKETDIDGWRLDVADEVDHRFWREFRRRVKDIKPDCYILGEIWHDARPWLRGDQFDAVMNYPFTYLIDAFLGEETVDGDRFANRINRLQIRYPEQVNEVLFNLVGSHDMARVDHRYGGDRRRVKLAMLLLLTFRGVPCLYYGDEVGVTGGDDPDCRRTMPWDPDERDRELFKYVRSLIALRSERRELRQGDITFTREQCEEDKLVFHRSTGGEPGVTVVVNRGSSPVEVPTSTLGDDLERIFATATEESESRGAVVTVPPVSGHVFG